MRVRSLVGVLVLAVCSLVVFNLLLYRNDHAGRERTSHGATKPETPAVTAGTTTETIPQNNAGTREPSSPPPQSPPPRPPAVTSKPVRPEEERCLTSDVSAYWERSGEASPKWTPYSCKYPEVTTDSLQACLAGRKLFFVGSAVLRHVMLTLERQLSGSEESMDWDAEEKVCNQKEGSFCVRKVDLGQGRSVELMWMKKSFCADIAKGSVTSRLKAEGSTRDVLVFSCGVGDVEVRRGMDFNEGHHPVTVCNTVEDPFNQAASAFPGRRVFMTSPPVKNLKVEEMGFLQTLNWCISLRALSLYFGVVDTWPYTVQEMEDGYAGNIAHPGYLTQTHIKLLMNEICFK